MKEQREAHLLQTNKGCKPKRYKFLNEPLKIYGLIYNYIQEDVKMTRSAQKSIKCYVSTL